MMDKAWIGLAFASAKQSKIRSIIILIILTVAWLSLDYSVNITGIYTFKPLIYDSITDGRTDDIYLLSMDKYYITTYSTNAMKAMANIYEMYETLDDKEGLSAGTYWFTEDNGTKSLYVSSSLLDLGDIDQNTKGILTGYDGVYAPMAVGSGLADVYPVGSLVSYNNVTFEVVCVMQKGTRWFAEITDYDTYMKLDDALVGVCDDVLVYDETNVLNGITHAVVLADKGVSHNNVESTIYDTADGCGIEVYGVTSLHDDLIWDASHLRELPEEIFIAAFLSLCGLSAFLMIIYVQLYSEKKYMVILLANGFTRKVISKSYSFANTTHMLMAWIAALIIWELQVGEFYGKSESIDYIFVPIVAVMFAAAAIIIRAVTGAYISHINIADTMGKESV